MTIYNNFELLLFASAEKCCNNDTKKFLEQGESNFELTQKEKHRFYRIVKQKINATWKAIKVAVIACLICFSLLFTACICISKIRAAIFEVVVEWYESYIAVGFEDPNKEDDHSPPPTEILNKAYASYLPSEYTSEVDIDNKNYYSNSYYSEDTLIFSLTQNVISGEMNWNNAEGQSVSEIQINGYRAVLIEDQNMTSVYSLIWRDQEYEYNIVGLFSNKDELIQVAEGVKTK